MAAQIAYQLLYGCVQLIEYYGTLVWDDQSVITAGQPTPVPVIGGGVGWGRGGAYQLLYGCVQLIEDYTGLSSGMISRSLPQGNRPLFQLKGVGWGRGDAYQLLYGCVQLIEDYGTLVWDDQPVISAG